MKKTIMVLLLALIAGATQAEQLAIWNFYGYSNTASAVVTTNAAVKDANLSGAVLTSARATRKTTQVDTNCTVLIGCDALDSASAMTSNDYYTITLTPAADYKVTVTQVVSVVYRNTSTFSLAIRGSVDSYAADLYSVSASSGGTITSDITDIAGAANAAVSLRYILFNHASTSWYCGPGDKNAAIAGDDLIIYGTVAPAQTVPTATLYILK